MSKIQDAPLCLRCPSRDKALFNEQLYEKDSDLKLNAFKKCKGWKSKDKAQRWRGFVEDANAPSFDALTDDDCKNALDQAFGADQTARSAVNASGFAGNEDEIEDAVTFAKTNAKAQFNGMPFSKQLLEHAYQKLYQTKAKAKTTQIPVRGSKKAKNESAPPAQPEGPKTGDMLTNHFEINVTPGAKLFEYQVDGFQDQNFTAPKKKVLLQRLVDASKVLKAKTTSFAYNKEGRIIAWEPLTDDLAQIRSLTVYLSLTTKVQTPQ